MTSDLHTAWAKLFVRCLATSGVRDVVLSPGSRSTPLALAAAHEPMLRTTVIVDERSAAFFALGQARVTGRPSVLICTSGSAGAHYHPAIVEADLARVPLIAITADRPFELQHAFASQTADQQQMYGRHVRAALELGEPAAPALRAVPRIAAQAVLSALAPEPGPVHVNARFRKPLEPVLAGDEPWSHEHAELMERGAPRVTSSGTTASDAAVERLLWLLSRSARPLLVAGPSLGVARSQAGPASSLRDAARAFATEMGVAVVAEVSSGLACGSEPFALVGLETLLRAGFFWGPNAPDLIVEVGCPPIAAGYPALVGGSALAARVLVAPYGFPDPFGGASDLIVADPASLLSRAAQAHRSRETTVAPARRRWTDACDRAGRAASRTLGALDEPRSTLDEPAVFRSIGQALPDGAVLVVGNSLVVRDLDAFGPPSRDVRVVHQRGASGIDGLVAGAAGVRSTVDANRPVVLVLGDVSAMHDVGSFGLLRDVSTPLVIVVVDNDGGRIFSDLPIAQVDGIASDVDKLFLTRPGRELLGGVTKGFGLAFARTTDAASLCAAFTSALSASQAMVIQAVADPSASDARRREAVDALRVALVEEGVT